MVGGLQGSTKGLRFNPRHSAEELQDDSTVGREDSEERARHDAKKRETQDKRAKQLQGLQHMKIKIPQKHEEDEEDSDMKRQAEAGQMSGQVGQNEANAGANPKGGGMNILLSTASFIDDAFDMIRKRKDEPKYDDEKPKKTTTIDTALQRRRAKKGKRSRKQGKKTTETSKGRKGNKKQLKGGNVRQPGIASTMSAARAPYTSFGLMGTRRPTPTGPIRLNVSTGRSQARGSYANPRKRLAQDVRQELRQDSPTQDITPPMPTITAQSRKPRAVRGSRDSKPHSKAIRQPRTTKTPGGAEAAKEIALGGGASAMAAGGLGSSDAILASEEFLVKRAQKLKLGISPRDRIEYRQLIDQLNHALRRLMRKSDASADDAPSGATPNQGTKRMTSSPTGPTETDPEDDPTMWGTHPYDLYVRRGGMG